MKRFQRLADGWCFHGTRAPYSTLPKVRNLEPVRLPIGGNSDPASKDRSERRQCRAAYIIWRALHPLANVANPMARSSLVAMPCRETRPGIALLAATMARPSHRCCLLFALEPMRSVSTLSAPIPPPHRGFVPPASGRLPCGLGLPPHEARSNPKRHPSQVAPGSERP